MKRLLIAMLLCAISVSAQQAISFFSIPDITGTGTAVKLATSGTARFCQLVALKSNSSDVRWGDSLVTASRGSDIAPGGGQFIPPGPTLRPGDGSAYIFALNTVYVYVAVSDVVTVTCAI